MTILGIDPGYDRLGYAIIKKIPSQKEELLDSGCLTSKKLDSFERRLATLGSNLELIFKKHEIGAVAIETLFVTKNQKTAMRVAEVRGLVLYLAGTRNLPVFELSPSEVKLAVTGYGAADKHQVTAMAKILVQLPEKIRHDDEFDAIVIALAGLAKTRLSR